MKILVAEDECDIARALEAILEREGYAVDVVHNGRDALDYATCAPYDGLILDIMMPKMDGVEVLKQLRQAGNSTPALFLTAKGDISDRVAGLDAGADDYLPKPFAVSELLARVRAMLRRRDSFAPTVITFGDIALDTSAYVLSRGDASCSLVGREFAVMQNMMNNPSRIATVETLMNEVWGWESEVDVGVVWVTISNIRKKLKKLGAQTTIETLRGAGYMLKEQA